MHCEEKLELRSHNTNCCLIEVVTETGLTRYGVNNVFNNVSEFSKNGILKWHSLYIYMYI